MGKEEMNLGMGLCNNYLYFDTQQLLVSTGTPLPDTIDNKPLEEMKITEAKQKMVREFCVLIITIDLYVLLLYARHKGCRSRVY